jgi:hypothetical protein
MISYIFLAQWNAEFYFKSIGVLKKNVYKKKGGKNSLPFSNKLGVMLNLFTFPYIVK